MVTTLGTYMQTLIEAGDITVRTVTGENFTGKAVKRESDYVVLGHADGSEIAIVIAHIVWIRRATSEAPGAKVTVVGSPSTRDMSGF